MATKRQVFYSFHYEPDSRRAAQVRGIGALDGNAPASDNGWEDVKKGGDRAIATWIDQQMKYRSCTVVLVGSNTANRKWINHEIYKSWHEGMGVVGICIHGLKDLDGSTSTMGKNPFDYVVHDDTEDRLSTIAKCYDPAGSDSTKKYAWISKYLAAAVEEAIQIRREN